MYLQVRDLLKLHRYCQHMCLVIAVTTTYRYSYKGKKRLPLMASCTEKPITILGCQRPAYKHRLTWK